MKLLEAAPDFFMKTPLLVHKMIAMAKLEEKIPALTAIFKQCQNPQVHADLEKAMGDLI